MVSDHTAAAVALLTARAAGDTASVRAVLNEVDAAELVDALAGLLDAVAFHARSDHGCRWSLERLCRYWGLGAAHRTVAEDEA